MADELMLEEIRQALRADFVEHLREAYRSAQQAEHRIFPKERERKRSQGRTAGEAFTLDGF